VKYILNLILTILLINTVFINVSQSQDDSSVLITQKKDSRITHPVNGNSFAQETRGARPINGNVTGVPLSLWITGNADDDLFQEGFRLETARERSSRRNSRIDRSSTYYRRRILVSGEEEIKEKNEPSIDFGMLEQEKALKDKMDETDESQLQRKKTLDNPAIKSALDKVQEQVPQSVLISK